MLTSTKASRFIAGLLLSGSPAAFSPALAQDADSLEHAALGSFATSNPNLNDWTLIKLTAADVGAALDGAGVKVAVLDGKADCRVSQLAGRCEFIPLPGATYSRFDAHGTHVSGIVGASPFGVAPAATILNYGVYADGSYVATGTRLSDTWKSAYAAGAQISSMSFACTRKALCLSAYDLTTMASPSLPMLFVKAAGNHGADLYSETIEVTSSTAAAALNKTLIVGSVNAAGVISTFSNRPGNGCLLPQGATSCSAELSWKNHFLVAPGEGIYSTLPNGQLGYMSGTSMATPVVAGVAALLQARWPILKNSPETLARILLTSATDLGAPGVDPIYGYGLLNATAAFVASGSVTIVAPPTSAPTSAPTSETSAKPAKARPPKKSSVGGGSFARLGAVLGGVTVFDQFGRDFRWDETGTLAIRANADPRQMPSRRLLGAFTQESWSSAFFSSEPAARSFMAYGSATDIPGLPVMEAPSLRAGVDVPLGHAAVQVRLTGPTNPRADLAYDPAMRPLAFFPSMNLATGSLLSNVLVPLGERSRLMVYGIASTGTVEAGTELPGVTMPDRRITMLHRRGQSADTDVLRDDHTGVGVSFWHQGNSGLILGANLSALRQKNAFYDTTIDVAGFDEPTNLVNLGLAASKASRGWDLSASAEVSHLRMNRDGQAIGFTPTTLISGELAVARSGVFFRDSEAEDSLRVAISLPPRAVAGNLRLDFMSPSADGMRLEPATRAVRVAELGHDPARLEAAYRVSSAANWSLELSGGVALERANRRGSAAEGLITFRTSL